MNKSLTRLLTGIFGCALLFAGSAVAQVQVGPGGTVNIKGANGGVHVGKDGVRIGKRVKIRKASKRKIKVGKRVQVGNGKVRAGGVRVGPNGVRAPGVRVGKGKVRAGRRAGKKAGPFSCKGNETHTLRGVNINVNGDAITVSGNCNLTIIDSNILSGGNAIVVKGSGDVTVKNTRINGKRAAIFASGSADVKAIGSRLRGRIVTQGSADFTKGKGTTVFK